MFLERVNWNFTTFEGSHYYDVLPLCAISERKLLFIYISNSGLSRLPDSHCASPTSKGSEDKTILCASCVAFVPADFKFILSGTPQSEVRSYYFRLC